MKGEHYQAIHDLTEAIRLNPSFAKSYSVRGLCYRLKGDYDRAIADCSEAIRLDPANMDAHYNRGESYWLKGDHDRAIGDYSITDCTEAIRLDPHNAEAYCKLGLVYFSKNDCKRAIANFHAAIGFDSNYAEAYYHLGRVWDELGKTGRAINNYTETIRLDPTYMDAYLERAFAYEDKYRFGRAITDYSAFIRLSPTNAEAYWLRGNLFRKLGEYNRANADYREAIRLDPEAKYRMAKCIADYCERGDNSCKQAMYEEAIAFFTMAIQLDPEDTEAKKKYSSAKLEYAEACWNQGYNLFQDEKYAEAIIWFTKAIQLNPEDEEIKGICALASCRLNPTIDKTEAKLAAAHCARIVEEAEGEDAIQNYNEAVRLDPGNANYYRKRGDAYLQNNEHDKAIADFTEAIRLNPADAIAYSNRAKAHRELGDERTTALPHASATLEREAEWHVVHGGNELGPLSVAEMVEKADAGEIEADDLVKQTGGSWTKARDHDFLQRRFGLKGPNVGPSSRKPFDVQSSPAYQKVLAGMKLMLRIREAHGFAPPPKAFSIKGNGPASEPGVEQPRGGAPAPARSERCRTSNRKTIREAASY